MINRRDSFVHLHLHSDRSLQDALCRIEEIVETVKRHQMPAVALTDHGNLFGALDFYHQALKAGVKPILGCEVYLAPGNRTDKNSRGGREGGASHLTLLCQNERGFKNLIELASLAYTEGFYYKPRIDKESLRQYHEGLIALSGCMSSEFCKHIRNEQPEKARATIDELRAILGPDNLFVELQDHGFDEQRDTYREALRIARDMNLPVVATNDVHYVNPGDHEAHDALVCLGTGSLMSDENRMRYATHEFWLKGPDEMKRLFREVPDAITNTIEIADRCNLELQFKDQHLPVFACPEGRTQIQYLREICEDGIRRRYAQVTDTLRDRLTMELATIEKAGFAGYFLIVWDFIRYAKDHGIPVGPGRGSAAGSLVAFVMGITDVDPLKYDLLFERFLNPGRIEMPDIDVDFCQSKRGQVIEYVRRKYGRDNVCQIITYGTFAARSVVRDVGRVMNIPLSDVDKIAKKIPAGLVDGKPVTLAQALHSEQELKDAVEKEPTVRKLFEISQRLEGNCRHAGTHAAGVVISDARLRNYVPLYLNKDEITTQWDMDGLTKVGLIKMDFLGLQTLTILDHAVQLIEKTTGQKMDLATLPLDDVKTYKMLARGESSAVFQLESPGMRDLLQKMKPDRFEDLIAILALFRPGPLKSGMVDSYVRCKHGVEKIASMHPLIDPILKETNGVILYQEQVMRIANRMAGFSLSEADALRKAMGKKRPELLAKFKNQFIEGARGNGATAEAAAKIFELMEFFAGYGFNKSHSTAYAWITWQTAWLKANHDVAYMAAVLTVEMGNTDKVVEFIEECRRLEIQVRPPDINASERDFTVDGRTIRFGLGAVKGIGDKAVEAIVGARRALPDGFRSLVQFCERVDASHCNRAAIEALIRSGSFDSFKASRAKLMASLDGAMKLGAGRQADERSGQLSFFGGAALAASVDPPLPDVPDWDEAELLAHEKASLGFYVTGHPLARFEKLLREYATLTTRGADRAQEDFEHVFGGMVSGLRAKVLQTGRSAGQKMHSFRMVDLDGGIEAVLFPQDAPNSREHLKEDAILFFKGKLDYRREVPQLKISDLLPLDKAREELTASVIVRLRAAGMEDETLEKLAAACRKYPGGAAVFLEVETADLVKVQLRAGTAWQVRPSTEFVAEVVALLGEGHLGFVKKGPVALPPPRTWSDKKTERGGSPG